MKSYFRKYLSDSCSTEDFESFIELATDKKNQKVFEENMSEDWKDNDRTIETPDLSPTLHRIHYELNKTELGDSKTRKLLFYVSRIAAVLFVPLLIAYFIQWQSRSSGIEQTIVTPLASQTSFELSDGTLVWLNAGSSIRFPSKFTRNKRIVKLTGEAYFDVKKGSKPFIVETKHVDIEVLGTAFNVLAYDNELPAITLERGKVSLRTESNQKRFLLPGHQATVDTSEYNITLKTVDTHLYSAWKDHQLIFKNDPLSTVAEKLERWYNVEIEIVDPSLLNSKVTAKIEFEAFREVLDLMQLTMPVDYQYDKDLRKLIITRKY
ncbi:FecR family protein [Sunxiuqinia indica]|uniref:FecR family protein n=1 Tax=Sunxiuqinia indica TaxID=2692584 RepID=UPI00135A801C|nr:FecR domain-containing protein [Sunxiuqinia indica]